MMQILMNAQCKMETAHRFVPTTMEAIYAHVLLATCLHQITALALVSSCICINTGGVIYSALDINECSLLNGNCSQVCTNTNGSYLCSCNSGYQLSSNNRSCNGMLSIPIL